MLCVDYFFKRGAGIFFLSIRRGRSDLSRRDILRGFYEIVWFGGGRDNGFRIIESIGLGVFIVVREFVFYYVV